MLQTLLDRPIVSRQHGSPHDGFRNLQELDDFAADVVERMQQSGNTPFQWMEETNFRGIIFRVSVNLAGLGGMLIAFQKACAAIEAFHNGRLEILVEVADSTD